MSVNIREEVMGPHFTKYHVEGLPFHATIHRIESDTGDPHDHPWSFRTHILHGYYVEKIFDLRSGEWRIITWPEGSTNLVSGDRIHTIIDTSPGGVWTMILPQGPKEREPAFYRWDERGVLRRQWNESEFLPVSPAVPPA